MIVPARLRVKDRGVGTVYLSLPIARSDGGSPSACVAMEREAIQKRIDGSRRALDRPKFLLLTGQADLAAKFEVDDFRSILELNYPRATESTAFVYNWVFSSIYDLEPPPPRIPITSPATAVPVAEVSASEPLLHFIVHARVLRSFYALKPIESEGALVAKIQQLFHGIPISIETGVGWLDLIISGGVAAYQFSGLLDQLIGLNTFGAGSTSDSSESLF